MLHLLHGAGKYKLSRYYGLGPKVSVLETQKWQWGGPWSSQVWWYTSVMPVPGRLRQKNPKSEANLDHTISSKSAETRKSDLF